MIYMKCNECGFDNNDGAKFCARCGKLMKQESKSSKSNSNVVIAILIIVIILLVGVGGFFVLSGNNSQESTVPVIAEENVQTDEVSSQTVPTKSWVEIGSYSGSGSGSKTINVPEGEIKIKLSAYPIKNYATNYLTVSGSNGQYGGVDWGSNSAVETRSDSFTYTSSSSETFVIDYYETVSWEVTFYRYQ